jgi:hypothetical protein
MAQTRLEEIAIEARKSLIMKNSFNDISNENNYSVTHTKAISDELTPKKGKGTGIPFDTYNGGSSEDVNGVIDAVGSGRISNVLKNKYSGNNNYKAPDMSGNVGQVTI